MLESVKAIFKISDVRRKVFFTIGMITIFRILAHIPLPGIDFEAFKELFARSQFLVLLNIFSGGALSNFSITALGLSPYINASIILQLLTMVFPSLEALAEKGEEGRQKINQYTRLLTLPLAAIQSFGIYFLLRNQQVAPALSYSRLGLMVLSLVSGSVLLIWLGGQVTRYGIGNGISVLIFAGILSEMPVSLFQTLIVQSEKDVSYTILFLAVALALIACIILVNEAQREIPIQYAKRVRGIKLYGGQATYLPLKLNQAGVIPIIFALSLVLFPNMVASFLSGTSIAWLKNGAEAVQNFLANDLVYGSVYFLLVIGFTYFYTAVQFDPNKIAKNLREQGGFIPGIRPGKSTTSYLNKILTRVTLVGAIFLGAVAVLPMILRGVIDLTTISLGGTGILIVVSVIVETVRQLESMLVMRDYKSFLR